MALESKLQFGRQTRHDRHTPTQDAPPCRRKRPGPQARAAPLDPPGLRQESRHRQQRNRRQEKHPQRCTGHHAEMSARRINSSHGRVRTETVGASDVPMRERFASRGWRFARAPRVAAHSGRFRLPWPPAKLASGATRAKSHDRHPPSGDHLSRRARPCPAGAAQGAAGLHRRRGRTHRARFPALGRVRQERPRRQPFATAA